MIKKFLAWLKKKLEGKPEPQYLSGKGHDKTNR